MSSIGMSVTDAQRLFRVEVRIGGTPRPLYRRPADQCVFVAGQPGAEYELVVYNLTTGRLEVVTAVDQRNTQRDEPADMLDNRGMVIERGGDFAFTGWRLDNSRVRKFAFGDPRQAVTTHATGSASGAGVIGFAVYQEKSYAAPPFVPPWAPIPGHPPIKFHETRDRYETLGPEGPESGLVLAAASREPGLGTVAGEEAESRVRDAHFDRRAGEPSVVVIRYDTHQALAAQGIIGPPEPDAFPGRPTGYADYGKYPGPTR